MTVATPDTNQDTAAATLRAYNLAIAALVLVVSGAFALSFHGLLDLLVRVGEIPTWLAWLGPIVVDFFALVGIFTGHAMRGAHWRRRAYAWLVTLVATALSVAGNVADARAKHLTVVGMCVFAVAPPVIFLSSHLIVVCRREVDERRRATAGPELLLSDDEEQDGEQDDSGPVPAKTLSPRGYARQQFRRGRSVKDIHAALVERGHQVTQRTVARYVEDLRAGQGADSNPTEPTPVSVT